MALIRDELRSIISKALKNGLSLSDDFEPEIEIPTIAQHGDYATNSAMVLAKTLKKNPREIASKILEFIEAQNPDILERVEIAGPGFINFFIRSDAFSSVLPIIYEQGKAFGKTDIGKGRYVQVEFVSANPTGPLHVGHGRGAAVGDALARILESCGYRVHREYYINDVGKQMTILGRSLYLRYLEVLGKAIDFPEDHYRGDYMKDLAQKFFKEMGEKYLNTPEEEALPICTKYAAENILEGIKKDLEDFRVSYDEWFSEESLHRGGAVEKAIEQLRNRGFIYEQDGAIWFRSSLFGDEKDRVIVRSNGAKTYFAADIAYHWNKIERGFDTIINIWGADHHGYVPRIKAVVDALGLNPERLKVILVQLVNLLRGGQPVAMSTRAGEFVTLREVMEEVGVDAARYMFLTRRSDSPLDFDLELAKAQSSENPVYYVQYAHARISSLFEVGRERGVTLDLKKAMSNLNHLKEPQEIQLMKLLGEFPFVLRKSAEYLEPHRIPYYLHDLASTFHTYYNHHRILTEDENITQARLALAGAIHTVLKIGLELIGLSAPDKM
ncbi:MAG: arginine--tRNA ligase [Syntrophobacterales bacterium]|nr:arginine--tRNA ligase [Syntrophobacterales bacterium]